MTDVTVCNLHDLTDAQVAALRGLKVTAHQEVLGKSFFESIEDWESAAKDRTLGLCVLFKGMPVGMTLFVRAPQAQTASIHGPKIALPWQGRGWGHLAFRLAVEHLREVWPEIRTLSLSVDAENTAALAIYRGFGMTDSGPIFPGPNGQEHHMEIALPPAPRRPGLT